MERAEIYKWALLFLVGVFYAIARTARVYRILSMFFQHTNASKDHQLESIYIVNMWTRDEFINIIQTSRTKSSKCAFDCTVVSKLRVGTECPIDSGTRVLAVYFYRQPYFDKKQRKVIFLFLFWRNPWLTACKEQFLTNWISEISHQSCVSVCFDRIARVMAALCILAVQAEHTSNGEKRVEPINRKPNIIMIQ